jgi:ubiquinone/menaquinone biosynthesis C-methylase UbiE
MSSSLAFDRAVSFYDKTRADPDWVADAITNSLMMLGQLTPSSRVLEIGIGTGRIALPITARAIGVIGIDLSAAMMDKLRAKIAGQAARVALAQADANALPFPDGWFDCAYAVHVYHVVAHWQNALRAAWRVLKPGGHLLISYNDHDPGAPFTRLRAQLAECARQAGIETQRPGAQSSAEIRAVLDQLGATQTVPVTRWSESVAPARLLEGLAAKIVSETWLIPDAVLVRIMPKVRAWAAREFGDLDRALEQSVEFNWLVAQK